MFKSTCVLLKLLRLNIMKRAKRQAVSNTELKAKKARGETELGNGLMWTSVKDDKDTCQLLALTSESLCGASKIAGFDIDFTVIKTLSGRTFAIGSNDWQFWHEDVPKKIREFHQDGFRIVFFTNQAGIEKGKVTPQSFKDKAEDIIKELNVPVLVFACTGTNHYRKPSTMMWNYCVQSCNQGVEVDMSQSVYVGDAAGRAKNWAPGKPKDFSCSDRMFASNIGIKFQTPEEFFLGEAGAAFNWGSVDPVDFLSQNPPVTKKEDKSSFASQKQEVVIMVGPPASGKSTFRQRYLEPHGYVTVNRDTMGTMEKCLKVAKESLAAGKSVVADNTNPSVSGRAAFVKLAQSKGVPCRCIWLQTPLELAHHLNLYRQNQTKGKVRRVPDVGYNVFKKNFEEPTASEGFSVVKLKFTPRFDSKLDVDMFKQWTV